MRISDWSSDVCSSDLEVMKLNRIAALLTTGIAATGAGFLPLSATAQDEVNTSPAGATQADTAASAANSAAQPDAASTDSDIAEVIVTAQRREEKSRDVPIRSEEHTSELQSLMRTSYAVFCL